MTAVSPESVTVTFGRRVSDLRTGHGWSLRKLSALVAADAATLSRIERGADTTLATAGRIAGVFGQPLAAMLRPVDCARCLDAPPRGFACLACGAAGPEVWL